MASETDGLVVVITGASSGIGRATAHAFAARGANVVLAARREEALDDVVRECRDLGGEALAVPTDTTLVEDVNALAQEAVERFGGIDIWFNNAGVGAFGRFEDTPLETWRHVIETNLFGYVFGARAALRQFRRQGHGHLINNASIAGRIGQPDSTAYVTSKFAVRGFTQALRQELIDEPEIHVSALMPAVIDTPFFQNSANYTGHALRAAPPIYTPEKVAETVVSLIRHPRAEVIVGGFGKLASLQQTLMPNALFNWMNTRMMRRGLMSDAPATDSPGAVFEAARASPAAVRGDWRHGANRGGVPTLVAVMAAAIPLGLMAARMRRNRHG